MATSGSDSLQATEGTVFKARLLAQCYAEGLDEHAGLVSRHTEDLKGRPALDADSQ